VNSITRICNPHIETLQRSGARKAALRAAWPVRVCRLALPYNLRHSTGRGFKTNASIERSTRRRGAASSLRKSFSAERRKLMAECAIAPQTCLHFRQWNSRLILAPSDHCQVLKVFKQLGICSRGRITTVALPFFTMYSAFVIGSQLSVTREIGVNDLDQAWCRGNLSCHNDMHSQL
jgi:hypothetical protein